MSATPDSQTRTGRPQYTADRRPPSRQRSSTQRNPMSKPFQDNTMMSPSNGETPGNSGPQTNSNPAGKGHLETAPLPTPDSDGQDRPADRGGQGTMMDVL